ncbi:hypothetical protein ACKVM4_28955, partial [Achromobacter xylosoxidans]|uniref:hypothetical protein n=1 Tax=Alcaligenes xylosoxydans xylosoxydans TaxID=85698 RepID=UPI0038FC223B
TTAFFQSILMRQMLGDLGVSNNNEEAKSHAAIIFVSAFVDWNSQIYISGDSAERDPVQVAKLVLRKTSERISRCLQTLDSSLRFRVQLRLYHGWHKGYEPTANKKAITYVLASTNCADLSSVRNVVFESNVGYGDRLLHALPQRLHEKLGIHLPNTLREQKGILGEKMVDTAMAADVVLAAANEPREWILVVAEDDDLIPPIFTAEALLSKSSSRIILLQNRRRTSNFVKLENIMVRL